MKYCKSMMVIALMYTVVVVAGAALAGMDGRDAHLGTGQRANFPRDPEQPETITAIGRHTDLKQPIFPLAIGLAQRR